MRKEKSCGAVIMRNVEGKYYTLLVKHTQGHWGFPKGHAENDEDETETAVREVKEETGLEVHLDTGFRDTSTYWPNPDVYKKVVYFVGVPVEGEEHPDFVEIEQVEWFSFTEAKALLSHQSDVAVLENACGYLKRVESE